MELKLSVVILLLINIVFVPVSKSNSQGYLSPRSRNNQCGPNEQYSICGASCATTCNDLLNSGGSTVECKEACRAGCGCKLGFVRDGVGRCISTLACMEDQSMRPCPLVRCANYCERGRMRDPVTGCVGCACNDDDQSPFSRCPLGRKELPGYSCGRVVNRRNCPETHYCEISPVDAYAVCCPKDALHGSDCPRIRCSNTCNFGRKKDHSTGCMRCACNEDTRMCGASEEYSECVTQCQPTCATLGLPMMCNPQCQPGCQCRGGYVRDVHGGCILTRRCPKRRAPTQCGPNEEYTECGSCEATCQTSLAAMACPAMCRVGCQCQTGYVRDLDGRCIQKSLCGGTEIDPCFPNPCNRYEDCIPERKQCLTTPCPQFRCVALTDPPLNCARNEKLFPCGGCENTCALVRSGESPVCTAECRAPSCACKEGFARNDNGKCIRQATCWRGFDADPVDRQTPRLCRLKPQPGPCKAAIPSFYFDPLLRSCRQFTYGGCKGNKNRFNTMAQCMRKCGSDHGVSRSQPSICVQPRVVGPCRGAFPRWYHNTQNGSCQRFVFGGCDGNDNNFLTEEDCQNRCQILRRG